MGLLLLSRHRDEEIIISEGETKIRVVVVEIQGDRVKLGFDAPRHISIHRKEVQQIIDNGQGR